MGNSISKTEVIGYLEAIVQVTDIGGLKHDSKKLLDLLRDENVKLDNDMINKFNIFKSMYLKEQREWEAKQGLGHRVSRYTD